MIEDDILSTSRPYVLLEMGPNLNKKYAISTDQTETGSYPSGGGFVADGSALIIDTSIQGIVPQLRKGSCTIKDLTGIWPSRFADLGRYESSRVAGTGPNLKFTFGWRGLKGRMEYSCNSMHLKSLSAKILDVKFDIGDDGAISITIDFISYSSEVYNNVIAYNWNDVIKTDPDEFWKNMLKSTIGGKAVNANPTAIHVISYIIDPDSGFSYGKTLKDKNIRIFLLSTGWKAKELTGNKFRGMDV